MKPASSHKSALIIIDVQNGFLHPTHWGTSRSTPECEANIARLLSAARSFNDRTTTGGSDGPVLICHVHHHSISTNSELHPAKQITVEGSLVSSVEAQDLAAPREGESVWIKNVNSAFIGTGLEAYLRQNNVKQLVICGLTTDHCVSTSTRMAANLRVVDVVENGEIREEGSIVLVGNACATYAKGDFDADTVHRVHLASLDGEFAQVANTAHVIDQVFTPVP